VSRYFVPGQNDPTPDSWYPFGGENLYSRRPEVGMRLGWRYAAWRVVEVRPVPDADLSDEDRQRMLMWKPEYRERGRPYGLVLAHERGPLLVEAKYVQRLHDGTRTTHVQVRDPGNAGWRTLPERYEVCSCHGDPWPCQDHERDRASEAQAARMERQLATAMPGVCAACLEPISARQKTVTFPEPSLIVPGAPPPVFHAKKADCWSAAERYELEKRLVSNPDAERIVTCEGLLFVHANGDIPDCSAGPFCSGRHGPSRARWHNRCYHRKHLFAGLKGDTYPRPTTDCGYRDHGGCLGVERMGEPPTAADLPFAHRPEAGR
jgi:hypothetical protein